MDYAAGATSLLACLEMRCRLPAVQAEMAQMCLITLRDGGLSPCRWISGNRRVSRRWHTQFQLNTSLRHFLVRGILTQVVAVAVVEFMFRGGILNSLFVVKYETEEGSARNCTALLIAEMRTLDASSSKRSVTEV